jgi:hypothetical protein
MAAANAARPLDLEHVGPGTLAGRYLRRFWHPVLRAQDLPLGAAVSRRPRRRSAGISRRRSLRAR